MIAPEIAEVAAQVKEQFKGKMPVEQIMYNLVQGAHVWMGQMAEHFAREGVLPLSGAQRVAMFKLLVHGQAETLKNFASLAAAGVDMSEAIKTSPATVTEFLVNFLSE